MIALRWMVPTIGPLIGLTPPALSQCAHFAQKLTAADGAALDQFGNSVALDGDTAVIAAYGDSVFSGSAYVFREVGGVWVQVAKLTAADEFAGDLFGRSVALHGDTAVIGAYLDDDRGSESGSAYVFREVGGVWTQVVKLTAADGAVGDRFGGSVALHGDTAVIGASWDDDGGSSSGSAYVFREVGGVWTQIAKLSVADGVAGDYFGTSIALDSDTAVIGASGDDDRGANSGSAYVFRESGGVWTQVAKLTAADGAADDAFGLSVALDGDTAVIGAYLDDDRGSDSGSAYVFRDIGGVWTQVAKLTAADGAASDSFGRPVALDGDTAVIGASLDDDRGTESGSAYAFREIGGVWTQVAKLTAADGAARDLFGRSVALSGVTAVIGAYQDDDRGQNSGSAYIFALEGSPDCKASGDVNCDNRVDLADLSTLLDNFGTTGGATLADGDINGDGNVNLTDLAILLANFGSACP